MRTRRALVTFVAAVATFAACAPAPEHPAQHHRSHPRPSAYARGWSTIHADARNSDSSPALGARDVTLAWERHFDGTVRIGGNEWTINVGPTVDPRGQLYLTSTVDGCHLQAIDARTGATRWCAPQVGQPAVVSSALLDRDGHVFVADGSTMYAFDRDGKEQWRHPIVGVPLSAQFTPSGRLLFVTHVGVVYVVDRERGRDVVAPRELVPGAHWDPASGLWACALGTAACPAANTLAIDPASGRFYFTFWTPGAPHAGLRAMRFTDGRHPRLTEVWRNDTLPGGSAASPDLSADGRRLYVTDNAGSLHAIDTRQGRTIWSYPLGFTSGGSVSTSRDGLIIPTGGPLQAIADDGDAARLVWKDDALRSRGIATQSAGSKAYATVARSATENDLVVVDTRTGAVLDREALPGATRFTVGTTMALDGTVFVPAITGDLYAFRPASRGRDSG
jgi:outer membrane protein assembly factor BamB